MKPNITAALKKLAPDEHLDLPLQRRYYASTVMTKLKIEIGQEYISRKLNATTIRITRVAIAYLLLFI